MAPTIGTTPRFQLPQTFFTKGIHANCTRFHQIRSLFKADMASAFPDGWKRYIGFLKRNPSSATTEVGHCPRCIVGISITFRNGIKVKMTIRLFERIK